MEENSSNFVDSYLEKDGKDCYWLKVRGVNGEPIPDVPAVFSYEQFGADFSFSASLRADEEGVFELGPMRQVKKLTATVTHNNTASIRTWKINSYGDNVTYGGPIYNNSYKMYLK